MNATFQDTAIYYILYPGDAKERGPHSMSELRKMWRDGTISGDTLFATEGMEEWKPVSWMRECMAATRTIRCDHCGQKFEGSVDVPIMDHLCPACGQMPVSLAKLKPEPPKVEAPKLVHCPDCGKEVSRRASSCPQCGAPISGPAPVTVLRMGRSRGVYVVLAVLLGGLGVHNFYASRIGVGLVQLAVTVTLGWMLLPLFFIWICAIVEACTVDRDGYGVMFT